MTGHQFICPYTGLRSFTEEESLYFKGRDQQIDQITSLLEQNKFLMLTGASGEGKSSLIYAGLVPNAKAGFFKAKYTNWVVADFRPERSPVNNMAEVLAKTFDSKPSTIETELRRGYSSLIDLFTNSDFYIDETDDHWKNLNEPEKKERERKAANLLIIVDQFEEFFTNPENFYKEAPSQDSQIVVNLVLETAQTAIKRNIPVYVVCTLRSDYIGQCSAFRGLPEYIGFSQFFVPRLKRKDLKQVIEEPAILSGNRISQRLIERLVYDIADGVDQLPILQHALSQIWLVADQGRQEMDLIHYAKVGGMPVNELPDEEQAEFMRWFDALPLVRQKYYRDTGLSKVIEIHASVLYENVWEYYNTKHPDHPITQQDAKRIIALTFSCLTKIDNSRAVRNRMSLGEITNIINSPDVTPVVVSEVLNIYREEGNSFIRPFKTEDPASHNILSETVLDITHESLIRNWEKLNTWANQEFEFYTTFLDFKKQLDRWKKSGKSRGYLLPIGPLTYFETWFNKCKPNVGWIKRYSEIQDDQAKATTEAESVLSDVRSFIKRSANKVAVSRAFMKYGAKRIAIVLVIAIMLVLSGFYFYDALQKQNSRVIKNVVAETNDLIKSKDVGSDIKAYPLLFGDRYDPGSMMKYFSGLEPKEKFILGIETYKRLLFIDKHNQSAIKAELTNIVKVGYKEFTAKETDYLFALTQINKFRTLLAYDQYYNPSDETEKILREFSDEGFRLTLIFFRSKALYQASLPAELNYGIQQWLAFGNVSGEKLDTLLKLISPFENESGRDIFDVYYSKGNFESNGRATNDYNGGEHTLASLYAAKGDTAKVVQCFETIRQSGQNDYFTAELFNDYTNILAIFYQFGYGDRTANMVKWVATHYAAVTPQIIYKNAILRSGYIGQFYRMNIDKGSSDLSGYYFPNLCMASRQVFNDLNNDYEKIINAINDPSERNFLLAMNEKRRAMLISKYEFDRNLKPDINSLDKILQQAVDHYRLIDKKYLEETVPINVLYWLAGTRNQKYTRKELFIYPDYMDGIYNLPYHSDLLFNFIDKNKLFEELYKTTADLGTIYLWIATAYRLEPYFGQIKYSNNYPISDEILKRILKLSETHPQGKSLDLNLVYLMMANRTFERGDTASGWKYYLQFDKKKLVASRERYEFLEKTWFLNQQKDLCSNLAMAGKYVEAVELAEKFEQNFEKAFAYIFMAEKIYINKTDPTAFVYLDSVLSKSKDIDFSQFNFGNNNRSRDFRYHLILLLSRIGGRQLNSISDKFLAEIIESNKLWAIFNRVQGLAEDGNFYLAKTAIPFTFTETEDLIARTVIIWQASLKKELEAGNQRWTALDEFFNYNNNYIFYRSN